MTTGMRHLNIYLEIPSLDEVYTSLLFPVCWLGMVLKKIQILVSEIFKVLPEGQNEICLT